MCRSQNQSSLVEIAQRMVGILKLVEQFKRTKEENARLSNKLRECEEIIAYITMKWEVLLTNDLCILILIFNFK